MLLLKSNLNADWLSQAWLHRTTARRRLSDDESLQYSTEQQQQQQQQQHSFGDVEAVFGNSEFSSGRRDGLGKQLKPAL
jgi:hypothetical protein